MKKIILFLVVIIAAAPLLHAQDNDKMEPQVNQKNLVKLNLLAFTFKSITVQYEREITRKTTVGLTLRAMPNSSLPFRSSIKKLINDPNTESQVDNFKTSNFAFMPEIRFYLGRKGAYHGFYIAPFFSYAHYTGNLPYTYTDSGVNKTIPLSGGNNTITGGLMFGAQWQLGKSFYLDWWMLGPHYGSSNGSISGKKSLSSSEQYALKSALDGISIPLLTTTNSVDANGATVYFKGPWAGVRSGLCIGFRF